jgi:nicotinamide mononucleotide transporter
VLFGVLFFQIQLYSDFVEQGYFLVTGFYGWWLWRESRKSGGQGLDAVALTIIRNSTRVNVICAAIVVIGTIIMGYGMAHIHEYLPTIFAEPASYPYLDAFTTMLSFAANLLLAQRRFECWFLWILVDIIGIGLYFAKSVVFVSLLYCVFLVLATKGLVSWWRILQCKEAQT